METLTIKPPKGISLEDAKIALERLNFQIIEEQVSFLIPEDYKKELHRRNEELEAHPETGISLEEARKIVSEKYGRI
jgi:hypothetical protein